MLTSFCSSLYGLPSHYFKRNTTVAEKAALGPHIIPKLKPWQVFVDELIVFEPEVCFVADAQESLRY